MPLAGNHSASTPTNCLRVSAALAVGLLFFFGGCGMEDVRSTWRTRPMITDGKNTEWDGLLRPLDEKGSFIGFVNDSNYLYVALVTSNHDLQRQVLRRGVTFWFDRAGGKDKKFGIQYPLGTGLPAGQRENAQDFPTLRLPGGMSDEIEIYTAGEEEHTRMTMAQTGGIEAKFGVMNDTLVYEMKVPLFDDGHHPFAIGTSAGVQIGAGVETVVIRPPQRQQEGSEEQPGERGGRGGMGGRRGGGRSGGGVGGGERQGQNSSPVDFWARLQLAGAPGSGGPLPQESH